MGSKDTRGKPVNWNPRDANKSSIGGFRARRPYRQAYNSMTALGLKPTSSMIAPVSSIV
jgi:hypothetical protein